MKRITKGAQKVVARQGKNPEARLTRSKQITKKKAKDEVKPVKNEKEIAIQAPPVFRDYILAILDRRFPV